MANAVLFCIQCATNKKLIRFSIWYENKAKCRKCNKCIEQSRRDGSYHKRMAKEASEEPRAFDHIEPNAAVKIQAVKDRTADLKLELEIKRIERMHDE